MPCPEFRGRRPNNTPPIVTWNVALTEPAALEVDYRSVWSAYITPTARPSMLLVPAISRSRCLVHEQAPSLCLSLLVYAMTSTTNLISSASPNRPILTCTERDRICMIQDLHRLVKCVSLYSALPSGNASVRSMRTQTSALRICELAKSTAMTMMINIRRTQAAAR
jgi:hypothetical protein